MGHGYCLGYLCLDSQGGEGSWPGLGRALVGLEVAGWVAGGLPALLPGFCSSGRYLTCLPSQQVFNRPYRVGDFGNRARSSLPHVPGS